MSNFRKILEGTSGIRNAKSNFMGVLFDYYDRDELPSDLRETYVYVLKGLAGSVKETGYKERLPDDLDERLRLSGVDIVQEKYGEGLVVFINDIEYRYVSDRIDVRELKRKLEKMMNFSHGKALTWLKANAVNYYGGKDKRTLTQDQRMSRRIMGEGKKEGQRTDERKQA